MTYLNAIDSPYAAIETAIVSRIAVLSDDGVFVVGAPTTRRIKPRAYVTAFFSGSQEAKPRDRGIPAAVRLNFRLNIEFQTQNHAECYPVIWRIRQLLQGEQFHEFGCSEPSEGWLFCQSIEFAEATTDEGKIWLYSMTFALDAAI